MGGKSPQQEIAELKKKLKKAEGEVSMWHLAMEIIEEEYGVDVKKKYLTKYQREVLKKLQEE